MSCNPAKILYVITDLNVGGVPLHLRRLATAMCDRGYRPTVVSLSAPGPVGEMLREDGIEVATCDGRGGWDYRVIGRLARIIARVQPRIIHSLLFHANLAAKWAASRCDFPHDRVVCEIQTVEVERIWHLWVDRITFDACRLTIGNSPSVVEHLAARARIPRDRLRLIKGGIDPAPLRAAKPADRISLGVPEPVPLLLWTGRLDPVKGLDLLIHAFAALARERDAHLLLVGEGPMRSTLETLIGRLGLTGRVHLLGRRSDVPSLLRAAGVFVLPSRTEGLPNALLEAMAAGCPIVTTDVPGCRDLIEHERTGLIVPYGDTRSLTAALRRLLDDRKLASSLGRQAVKEVSHNWHFEQTLDACAALYGEITCPVAVTPHAPGEGGEQSRTLT